MKRYQELQEKYKDKPEFVNSKYGDPFDGEKVSQLTTSFPPESESESASEERSARSERIWGGEGDE